MYVRNVVSYGNAWRSLVEQHPHEVQDIKESLTTLTAQNIRNFHHVRREVSPTALRECWESAISAKSWTLVDNALVKGQELPIAFRRVGHVKNRVSVTLQMGSPGIHRWLYTNSSIAVRNGFIDIPLAIIPLKEAERHLFNQRTPYAHNNFEVVQRELATLAPLSHPTLFAVLGMSHHRGAIEVLELESESVVASREIIIDRSIEFPPEYYQAGLGILSYFGTVLRENYPDQDARVRIEQDGLKVRLIVESANGDRDVIEKALAEYHLVLQGQSDPEELFQSKSKVLELKNELRIAQLRIESQRDLLTYQKDELRSLRELLNQALGLPSRSAPLTISVSPMINVQSSRGDPEAPDLGEISECLQRLIAMPAVDDEVQRRLIEIKESTKALAANGDPEEVKKSTALRKLKRFLDEANEAGSAIGTSYGKARSGVKAIRALARKYNDVAAWCGAPQVPSIFLG